MSDAAIAVCTAEDIIALTSIDDIKETQRKLDDEEAAIDNVLEQMLSEGDMHNTLTLLDDLRPMISKLSIDCGPLMETISSTAGLAEKINDKVRRLDQEKARVKETIQYVEDVQELKRCVEGIQDALQRRAHSDAAKLLFKAKQIDPSTVNGAFAEFSVPTSENPDHPADTLEKAKTTLLGIFSQDFDDAVGQRNVANITRYFKLFPLIGCHAEGLERYSRYVCNTITAQCSEDLQSDAGSTDPYYFAKSLLRLFNNVENIIDQHQPLVDTHYGKGKMLHVIQRLQDTCDTQGGLLLDRFLASRKLEAKLVDVQSLSRASISSSLSPSKEHPTTVPQLDLRQLNTNLLELTFIIRHCAWINRFLQDRATRAAKYLDMAQVVSSTKDKRRLSQLNGLVISSDLIKRIDDLVRLYRVIDEYILGRNLIKAMEGDGYDTRIGQSQFVDDFFFVLKENLQRSISTYNTDIVSTTLHHITKYLEKSYIPVIQRKMAEMFPNLDQGTVTRSSDRKSATPKAVYMIALNNLNISAENMQALVDELRVYVENDNTWSGDEIYIEAVSRLLDELSESTSLFKQPLQSGLEQLFKRVIRSQVRPLFQESYREVKYVLEEDEYREAEIEDMFLRRFKRGFLRLIDSYKLTLTTTNFDHLLKLVVGHLTSLWEQIVTQTRFNQYGSLRYDKDLRAVMKFLSSQTEWLSLDDFTRLKQMAILLNFEEPSEIYDNWGPKAGFLSWRLTVPEVKKVLRLRLDFNSDEVANLAL